MSLVTSAATFLPPEIAPDGIQQDAQAPGRAAAGEENAPAGIERVKNGFLDFLRPARFHELAEFSDDVIVHVEQQLERGGDVGFGNLT
jgi:hypothetical protein